MSNHSPKVPGRPRLGVHVLLFITFLCGLLVNAGGRASTQDPFPQEPQRIPAAAGQTASRGIWISHSEIQALPMSGNAWQQLKSAANRHMGEPDLSDQDDDTNVLTLARALVYARTGETPYRNEVVSALRVVTHGDTENGGRTLALGRNLVAYIVAADIIDLPAVDPELNTQFKQKLRELLTKQLDGRSLVSTHEERPNNWGTHAGASRVAIALYLGDSAELEKAARVFKGWLGDRSAYAGFSFDDDLSWQCDPSKPVGINPKNCSKNGHSIDGAQPEEMRRGGSFTWPPEETGYPWEALQGALVTAELLQRAGYNAWNWQDKALLRSVEFLYSINWRADGDDVWLLWLVNNHYDRHFPIQSSANPGKNMGWTAWTHGPQFTESAFLPMILR